MKTFFVYTDGGAVNNPGPAGIGIVIKLKSENGEIKTIYRFSEYIGEATNNQAEYHALIRGLKAIKEIAPSGSRIQFLLDSELLVNQLNLKYRVKNKELQLLFLEAHNTAISLGSVSFMAIRREQNKEADKLVREAIKNAK